MGLLIAIDGYKLVTEPLSSHATYAAELARFLSHSAVVENVYLLLPRANGLVPPHDTILKSAKLSCVNPTFDVFPERTFLTQFYWIQYVIPSLLRGISSPVNYYVASYHHPPVLINRSVRVVTVIHDLCGLRADCGYTKTKKAFYRHLLLFLIASLRSNAFIPISKYTKTQFERQFPFLSSRVKNVVYNGVNCRPVNQQTVQLTLHKFCVKSPYFLAYGNPGLRKGFDVILRAFKLYRERSGQAKLVLIVADDHRRGIEKEISRMRVDNIIALPNVGETERDALYSGAVAFLFPSRCEGFGYPIIEAMRQGCPPIAPENGPAPEILEGVLPVLKNLDPMDVVLQMETFEKMGCHERRELAARLLKRSMNFTGETFGHDFLRCLQCLA